MQQRYVDTSHFMQRYKDYPLGGCGACGSFGAVASGNWPPEWLTEKDGIVYLTHSITDQAHAKMNAEGAEWYIYPTAHAHTALLITKKQAEGIQPEAAKAKAVLASKWLEEHAGDWVLMTMTLPGEAGATDTVITMTWYDDTDVGRESVKKYSKIGAPVFAAPHWSTTMKYLAAGAGVVAAAGIFMYLRKRRG